MLKRKVSTPWVIMVWMVPLTSCGAPGQASLRRRDLYGGTLALMGDERKAMEDAHRQMFAHCRGVFTVVSEEMVAIGQQSVQQGRQEGGGVVDGPVYGGGNQYGQVSTTTPVLEHQLSYRCGRVTPQNTPAPYTQPGATQQGTPSAQPATPPSAPTPTPYTGSPPPPPPMR